MSEWCMTLKCRISSTVFCMFWILDRKLHYFVAFRANEVVVLLVAVGLLVLCQVLAKLVFAHQVTLHQQVQRVVYGGPAYAVVFVFHADIQRFHVKVAVAGIDLFQDRIAFGVLRSSLFSR